MIDNCELIDCWDAPAVRTENFYSCCPEPYVNLAFHLRLQRRSLYYVVYMIAPISAVAFLALITFCLPPDSGEKIGFGQ